MENMRKQMINLYADSMYDKDCINVKTLTSKCLSYRHPHRMPQNIFKMYLTSCHILTNYTIIILTFNPRYDKFFCKILRANDYVIGSSTCRHLLQAKSRVGSFIKDVLLPWLGQWIAYRGLLKPYHLGDSIII